MAHRRALRDDAGRRGGDGARADRAAELLDAALTVIRRDGPGASMEAMAAQAGVTKPILYRHFDDRDGLVRALAEGFAEDLAARLEPELERHGDPRDNLTAAFDAYIGFIGDDPNLYGFLTRHARIGGPVTTGVVDRIAATVARSIGEGLRVFGADSGAAEPWAYGIVGMLHQAGAHWVDHPTMPRERLVEYLVSLVWDGLTGYVARTGGSPATSGAGLGGDDVP